MTNRELGHELKRLAGEERKLTNQILNLIVLGLERRAYLEHGFSSMFDWLTRGFGYSHSAAYRRIEAARLIEAVPEAAEKLATGQVNLTTLSQAQCAIRAQEKADGQKLTLNSKSEIVEKIEGKSSQEAERVLCALLPENARNIHQERKIVLDEHTTRCSMNFTQEMMENLNRAKEVLSHMFPQSSDADIVAYALKFLLNKVDTLRKKHTRKIDSLRKNDALNINLSLKVQPSMLREQGRLRSATPATKRVTTAEVRREVLRSTQAACSYQDPVTGHMCRSRYQIELDHIYPKALSGEDEAHNLRPLCRQHNLLVGENVFGKKQMDRYRKELAPL